MNHLTTKQVLQIVDGTLDYAAQAQCTSHLAVCERCRREVDFQKGITKAAKRQPIAHPSTGFLRSVMRRVAPRPEKSWRTRFIDNLGNIIAMATVLAVLGYAISTPSLFQTGDQPSQQSFIPPVVSNTYAKIVESLAARTSDASKQVVASTGNESTKMISLSVLSLVILVAFDQFVLKKRIGIHMKS